MPTCRALPSIRTVGRVCNFILGASVLFSVFSITALGQTKGPARLFNSALREIRSKTRIPILLPSKLPSAIPESEIKLASGEVRPDGYFISLYYTEDTNASYAAGFGATKRNLHERNPHERNPPNSVRVALTNGRNGIFEPVSCGGSCAPANLWWNQNGVTYQIQVKLRADLPEASQRMILVETANRAVVVR